MASFQLLFILAFLLYIFSAFHFYQFWNEFKKLNIGDTLSKEFSIKSRKRIKVTLFLFATGVVLNLLATFVKQL